MVTKSVDLGGRGLRKLNIVREPAAMRWRCGSDLADKYIEPLVARILPKTDMDPGMARREPCFPYRLAFVILRRCRRWACRGQSGVDACASVGIGSAAGDRQELRPG